ncbi:MAG: YveK family protein [Clostridiaceae bacterium]
MKEEFALDIRGILHLLKKRFFMIAAITIVCGLIAGILSFYVLKPVYQAQATIIVGKSAADDRTQQYSDIMMYQNLVKTYSEIAKSKSVAKVAKSKLNFDITPADIQDATTISTKEGTQLIIISVDNNNAQQAVDIVNALSPAFIEESARVFPTGVDIRIMDQPELPTAPVSPRKALNISIALLLGLFFSVALAYTLEYLDKTIKDEKDVENFLDLPVIGIIPKDI